MIASMRCSELFAIHSPNYFSLSSNCEKKARIVFNLETKKKCPTIHLSTDEMELEFAFKFAFFNSILNFTSFNILFRPHPDPLRGDENSSDNEKMFFNSSEVKDDLWMKSHFAECLRCSVSKRKRQKGMFNPSQVLLRGSVDSKGR